jgi:hypothetical protein
VEAFARKHHIPIQWPDDNMKKKGIKKEDPYCLSTERRKRFGVYFIFKSMEQGPTFLTIIRSSPLACMAPAAVTLPKKVGRAAA